MEQIDEGLSAQERGSMVHKALELFWHKFQAFDRIKSLSTEQLTTYVKSIAAEVVRRWAKRRPVLFRGHFKVLETERLINLLLQWLQVELQRPPFKVLSTETQVKLRLEKLLLHAKLDRIDRLDDGTLMLIDYKTNTVSTAPWLYDRLTEPQLPLYFTFAVIASHPDTKSSSYPDNVTALAYSQLQPNAMKFTGYSRGDTGIPGVVPIQKKAGSWEEQTAIWRSKLLELAREFVTGNANITPWKGRQTCRKCHLSGLCRISEIKLSTTLRGDKP